MKPYYEEAGVTVFHGDCIEVMRGLPDASIDAVVTDPPYGLEFMGKEWDGADGFRRSLNEADVGRDSVFGRTSQKAPEYRTKPAGKVAQIGEGDGTPFRRSTGTPGWGASGNPVCLNCGGTKYDRTRDTGCSCDAPRFPNHMASQMHTFQAWCEVWAAECLRVLKPGGHMLTFGGSRTWHRLAAAVEDSGFEIRDSIAWLYGSGMPKHNSVLKPAFEPIVVGRKPLAGTIAANVLAHGTGALNIDANRVGGPFKSGWSDAPGKKSSGGIMNVTDVRREAAADNPDGRWPTNVILDEAQAAELDKQTGVLTSGKLEAHHARASKESGILGAFGSVEGARGYGDSGGASRFFPTFSMTDADWEWERRVANLPTFHYEAKAPTAERPSVDGVQHPTVKPLDLMRWLVRLVTPPGGTVLEPFAGSGTTIEAALLEGFNCIGIEREEAYLPLIMQRIRKPLQQGLFGDWDGVA